MAQRRLRNKYCAWSYTEEVRHELNSCIHANDEQRLNAADWPNPHKLDRHASWEKTELNSQVPIQTPDPRFL